MPVFAPTSASGGSTPIGVARCSCSRTACRSRSPPYGEPELYYSPPIERMERLEVVKGSGSILFGPQTVGGVLNYVTWEVPREASGDVRAEGGTGGVQYLRVRYGGGSDAARAGVTAFQKRADDLNGLRLTASDATAKFGVRVGENQFGLKISLYDESSNATYVGLTDSLYRATPHAHPAPDDRLRLNRYAFTATHDRALGAMISLHTAEIGRARVGKEC